VSKILLAPLDPVHDIGLKLIARGLSTAGYNTILLPPDLSTEEIIEQALCQKPFVLLISRTIGYGVAETLARLVDLADAAGIRDTMKIGVGGMAIRPELAAELGFDAGFGQGTTVEQVECFIENREYIPEVTRNLKKKQDITSDYDYAWRHPGIADKIDHITEQLADWAAKRSSPGVQRAQLRDEAWDVDLWRARLGDGDFYRYYSPLCGEVPKNFYTAGQLYPKTRRFKHDEVFGFEQYLSDTQQRMSVQKLHHTRKGPLTFNQYGTGCPMMDIGHILASEAWGVDGVVHFDPSWGARTEGLLNGFLTHQEDGTIITPANLNRIHGALAPSTLWQVRAHRGLNTPETVVLAGKIGADLTKINICYGALAAGTDPARMTIDGYHSILYAKKYNMPFDVVTNEELSGVPAHKAFAGMLIVAGLALRLGAKPILQPLFAYSPEARINGLMADNYVDFNAAKIYALRAIIDAPIWPGAPVGFLTHTEDRIQSAMTTALHACLAASLNVDAVSIASTDEAYSGGPISVAAKIDTLRAVKEGFRFFGQAGIMPTEQAKNYTDQIISGIEETLNQVLACGNFVEALHAGLLGSQAEGANPGRAGKDTVKDI